MQGLVRKYHNIVVKLAFLIGGMCKSQHMDNQNESIHSTPCHNVNTYFQTKQQTSNVVGKIDLSETIFSRIS